MVSEEKIKQVISAIKENGLRSFNDESLAKLLSILTPEEFEMFLDKSYSELGGVSAVVRINSVRSYVSYLVNNDLNKIYNSDIYKMFLESLKRNEYYAYFKSLTVEELASLKKYLTYNYSNSKKTAKGATKKVINMITKEIRLREQNKNLVF